MKKIGITGNIASGKSTVEHIISAMGYAVIDADEICHTLLESDENVISSVKLLFEKFDVLDDENQLDRRKIAKIVFDEPEYKKELENIIHPVVIEKMNSFFCENCSQNLIFASVPLLFEASMQGVFDKIILVCADEKIRLDRLMKRNNLSEDVAQKRIDSQMKEDDKIPFADLVIFNNKNLSNLQLQTENAVEELLKLFE